MGFEPPRKTYRLEFETPELAGLEVTARSMAVGPLLELVGLADDVSDGNAAPGVVEKLLAQFAGVLVSWNVEHDGQPVPADVEGLKAQDLPFILAVIMAWVKVLGSVGPPLPAASGNGASTAPEASIPTETLSPSPPS